MLRVHPVDAFVSWPMAHEHSCRTAVRLPSSQRRGVCESFVSFIRFDRVAAKAILAAFRNADIRHGPIKSLPWQVSGRLHRIRSGRRGDHTATVNALRSLLRELGHLIPTCRENVVPGAPSGP